MGNSDLRKIRDGRMSPEKIGTLKAGRFLGIVGTAFFVVSVALLVYLMPSRVPDVQDFFSSRPLRPDQIVFVGEWRGNKGTVIRIRPDGGGDFKTGNSSVTGGRVKIDKDSLAIGMIGIYKTWRIEKRPRLENGNWIMNLNGEIFTRKEKGQVVRGLKGGRGMVC